MFFKKKKKECPKEEFFEPVPPGINGYASIQKCPYCGNEFAKIQPECPFCNKQVFPEEDFNFDNK